MRIVLGILLALPILTGVYATPHVVAFVVNKPEQGPIAIATFILFGFAIIFSVTAFDSFRGSYGWLSERLRVREQRPEYALRQVVGSAYCAMLGFANVYFFLSTWKPSSFNKPFDAVSAVYFSIVTFATVGYGDFYPTEWYSQIVIAIEILFSMTYFLFIFSLLAGFLTKK